MHYSPQDISQGTRLKRQAADTPSSFGTVDGSAHRQESAGFGKTRMAGPVGERAIQLMNDPAEQQRTNNWMSSFGYSNQGYEFNQAKMMMAGQLPEQQQEETQEQQ